MTEADLIETKSGQHDGAADEIAVTVACLAYNHGKYIRDALEGYVHQKTTFKYEVIVHDDASTDGTAEIIREYAEKYPDIIKPILQTENQYSRKVHIDKEIILPQIRGRYVLLCECDDYWTDQQKLQRQFDAMESHPECSICCHYTKWIKMENGAVGGYYPNKGYKIGEGLVEKNTQVDVSLYDLFHLSSAFLRMTVYNEFMKNAPEFVRKMPVGDVSLLLYFANFGEMYFIDREMSVYRKGTEGSWTQRIIRNPENAIRYFEKYRDAMVDCKQFFDGKYDVLLDRKISDCSLGIAAQKQDYKTLRKNMSYVRRIGGRKWALKVIVCAACPPIGRSWDKLKKIRAGIHK